MYLAYAGVKGVLAVAVCMKKNNTIKIIDRTIPEIYKSHTKLSRLDIIDLCWQLKELKVDLIEVNSVILEKLGKLPAGIEFLLRILSAADIQTGRKYGVRDYILNEEVLDLQMLDAVNAKNMGLTIEIYVENVKQLYSKKKTIKQYKNSCDNIKSVRILGLAKTVSSAWVEATNIFKQELKVDIDICPDNKCYSATAIGLEAIMNGMDFVTVTFTGYGSGVGYAALEEILAALRVIADPQSSIDLSNLPAASKCFSKITGQKIHGIKPILGRDIFKYESGIHADGIEKNPMNYEPFEPEIVGQQRVLTIGKHSGSKAVAKKLRELGMYVDIEQAATLLRKVRRKSIRLKRELRDDELRKILGASTLAQYIH